MSSIPGWRLRPTVLHFDPANPARCGTHPYKALRTHGPFDTSGIDLGPGSILFVFPEAQQALAHTLADSLLNGTARYPGFEKLFRLPVAMGQALTQLRVPTDLRDNAVAASAYKEAIQQWNREPRDHLPDVAIVLVPHSERFQTDTPYYEAKAAFAHLGVPTQMATIELLADSNQLQWSVANIALATFAKLGGIPWSVGAPDGDADLIIGIGRADIGPERRQHFGYAISFVSNGIYRQTHSFTPTADEGAYEERLREAIHDALKADLDQDLRRLVFHLSSRAGTREIKAAQDALNSAGVSVPVAFLRLDDSSMHDLADVGRENFDPVKGTAAKLGRQRALLQAEELSATGAPDGPLLIELDRRSTVSVDDFDDLVEQAFRLAHANWRGFNARSKPATLIYGEQLAQLVGHLQDVESWNPHLLPPNLKSRPWFL